MRKFKKILLLLIGFILGALAAAGVYFLTVGEVAWKEYVETKLIPNAVLAITVIGGLATASLPIIAKVQAAVDKFNKATQDVNDTALNGRKSESEISKREARMAKQFSELNEKLSLVKTNTEVTKEMCKIGFCNTSELVQNGYAAEIAKAEAKIIAGAEDEEDES